MASGLGTFSGGGLGMGVMFNLYDNFSDNSKKIQGSMSNLSSVTDKTAAKVDRSLSLMKGGFTSMAIGGALAAPFAVGVKKSMEFNKTMSEVYAKARVEDEATQNALKQSALDLGVATKFTATEAAQGMTFLAMAGFNAEQTLTAMPAILNLAAAGNLDLAKAADIASNILSGMGMSAEQTGKLVDVMALTATSANTDIIEMGEAFKQIAPTLNILGESVESGSAAIALLANNGIKGTDATTSLNTALGRLSKPTAQMRDKMEELNLTYFDAQGEFIGLESLIRKTNIATKNLTTEQKLNAISTIFGAHANKQFTALLNSQKETMIDGKKVVLEGADAFAFYRDNAMNAAGAAATMSEKMLDNLAGDFTKLESIIDTTFIGVGDSVESSLRPVIQIFTSLVTGFNNFVKTDAGKFVLKLVAGIAAFLVVGGLFVGLIGAIQYAFLKLIPQLWAAVAPMLPMLLMIGGLVAGFYLMNKAIEESSYTFAILGVAIATLLAGPLGGVAVLLFGVFQKISKSITEFNDTTAEELKRKDGIGGFFQRIAGFIAGAKQVLSSFDSETGKFKLDLDLRGKLDKLGLLDSVNNFATWVYRISKMLEGVKEVFIKVFGSIKKVVSSVMGWISEKMKSAGGVFDKLGFSVSENTDSLESWKDIGTKVGYAIIGILGAVTVAFVAMGVSALVSLSPIILVIAAVGAAIYGVIRLVDWLKESHPEVWGSFVSGLTKVWEYTKWLGSAIWDVFVGIFEFLSDIGSAFGDLFDTGDFTSFFNNLAGSVSKLFTKVWGIITTLFKDGAGKIADWLDISPKLQEIFGSVYDTLVSWVGSIFNHVIGFLGNLLGSTWTYLGDIFNSFTEFFDGGSFMDLLINIGSGLWNFIKNIGSNLMDLGSGIAETAWSIGVNFVTALWGGIKSIWAQFTAWVSEKWTAITSKFNIGGIFNSAEDNAETQTPKQELPKGKDYAAITAEQNAFRWVTPDPIVIQNTTTNQVNNTPIVMLDGEEIGNKMFDKESINNSRRGSE